jgi:hypothetical protein
VSDKDRERMINAGCDVLYDHIAEAHEPQWREVVWEIYKAMAAKGSEGRT